MTVIAADDDAFEADPATEKMLLDATLSVSGVKRLKQVSLAFLFGVESNIAPNHLSGQQLRKSAKDSNCSLT